MSVKISLLALVFNFIIFFLNLWNIFFYREFNLDIGFLPYILLFVLPIFFIFNYFFWRSSRKESNRTNYKLLVSIFLLLAPGIIYFLSVY